MCQEMKKKVSRHLQYEINQLCIRWVMGPDNVLMIPHLSRELNLIGFPTLPYTLRKPGKAKSLGKCNEKALEIIFDSRRMLEALTSICFELVKQVKRIGEYENPDVDKLKFENLKLEKQLKLNKSETEKTGTELAAAKKANQQLQEQIDKLQKKVRYCENEQQNLAKRNQTNEDILKHALKKKEVDLFELHKSIWKRFNMANQNYLPENFELIQLNQPNFSKLWSTVKYSDAKTREEALKKAVCLLQDNNKTLMEQNFSLKTSFLTVLQEIHEVFKLMVDKLHMPSTILINFKIKEILEDFEMFNVSLYSNILQKHLKIIRKVCDLFEEASFTVSDDLFICWNDIIKRL